MAITSAEYRLKKIIRTLRESFGISINLNNDMKTITESLNYYQDVKSNVVRESHFGMQTFSPQYSEAVLICEALNIYLKEIAPTRKNRKKSSR